jgi:hypothetical protein
MNGNYIDGIINDNGKFSYAYVVLLIQKDIYSSASIVLAESIRKLGCLGDLVIMVDKKISLETISMIKKFYNKIIKIDPILINNDDPIQNVILSKINAFSLSEYKKIFLIDVDTIIFTNIDNYFISSDIPAVSYLEENKNYGFLLIEPSDKLFMSSIKLIEKSKSELKNMKKPFDFIIDKLFPDIKKLSIKLSSKKNLDVDCIQYKKDKPFLMSSSLTIESRMKLDHFKIWFSSFISILNRYPELKKISSIQETIEVSKYFLAPMSRFLIQMIKSTKDKKHEQISKIYGKVKYNNLEYYHLDISKDYSGEYLNYIGNVNGIKVFLEYLTFTTRIDFSKFSDYTSSKEIIDFFTEKVRNDKKNKSINKYQLLINLFISYYIKIFSTTFIILEINKKLTNTEKLINKKKIFDTNDILDLKNNLLYNNVITVDGKILHNIMFCLFQNYTYAQRLEQIKKFNVDLTYSISYYIYETIGQIDFFDMYGDNSNLFVLFDKSSKIRFGSIFLNLNTIEMFKNSRTFCNYIQFQNKNIILDKNSLINLIYFQTLKKWIYSTYSANEIGNIIIAESDLDLDKSTKSTKLTKSYNFNNLTLIDNTTNNMSRIKKINANKIFFVNIIFLKSSQYKNILDDKKKIIDSITNPQFYWELEGIKFMVEKIKI